MVEVNVRVNEAEAKAYIDLLNDAKVPPEMGYILTTLKYKIMQQFQEAQEKSIPKKKRSEKE